MTMGFIAQLELISTASGSIATSSVCRSRSSNNRANGEERSSVVALATKTLASNDLKDVFLLLTAIQ